MIESDSWRFLTESVRGFAHDLSGLPNQDSHLACKLEIGGRPAAFSSVADGHGSRRHFRSGTGSLLAVSAARDGVLAATAEQHDGVRDLDGALNLKDRVVPLILEIWRSSVADDVSHSPFDQDEESLRLAGDTPEIAYGSTLLVGVWTENWLLCLQIGDGDIVVVESEGGVLSPVPEDPHIIGHRTTSLCQKDALQAFRYAIVDASPTSPLALLLATDGFANSRSGTRWEETIATETKDRLDTGGIPLLEDGLRSWVAVSASSEGSGDDTTVSVVVNQQLEPS